MKLSAFIVTLIALATFYFTRSQSVEVTHLKSGPSIQAVFATGIVEATVMYPISSPHMGRLVELNVDEGAVVKKDQVLGKLQDDKILNAVTELQAKEKFLVDEFSRQLRLIKTKATAKDTFEKARSELDAARAATKGVIAQNEELALIAKIDGNVIRRRSEERRVGKEC